MLALFNMASPLWCYAEQKPRTQLDVSVRPVLLILHAYVSRVQHGVPVMVLGRAKNAKKLDVSAGRQDGRQA